MRQDVYFLFPGKIHPPATTAHSIVATKVITERNCIFLLQFFPPQLPSTCPRNEIDVHAARNARIAKGTLGGKLLPRFNLRPVRPRG